MKRTAITPLIAGTLMALLSTGAAGQDVTPDTAAVDSARLAQLAVQAELSREVDALSRSNLGSGQFTWTHVGQFVLERAGRQQKQVFWNNPKASATPHLWQVVNGPSDVVFYLDPEQGRAATIDLETLQGNFIPANIAAKAGFTETRRSSSPKNPMPGRRLNPPIPQRFIRQPSTVGACD